MIIHKRFEDGANVLGHRLGHGGIPVGVGEGASDTAELPIEGVRLAADGMGTLFQNGYVILQLQEPTAEVAYCQYDAGADQETVLYSETL